MAKCIMTPRKAAREIRIGKGFSGIGVAKARRAAFMARKMQELGAEFHDYSKKFD